MQLRTLPLGLLAWAAGLAPAAACSLALGVGGTLALSADGARLGSDEAGGRAATFIVANLLGSAATLTVSPPVIASSPPGFNVGTARLFVAYSGVGLLASARQSYTSAQTAFGVPRGLAAVTMTVNNRVANVSGFASGTYQTRTVVTCS